jgi:Lon-like protease
MATPTTTRVTTKVNTVDPMVSGPLGPPEQSDQPDQGSRPRRRRWLWAIPAALVVAALVSAALVTIPYYAIAPGSALSVTGLVTVTDGPSHPPQGEVFLTTVSLRRITVLEGVQAWLDSSIEVRPEREILGEVPPERLREFNLELMADSKQKAMAVAFETLGYDVRSGSGALVFAVVPGTPAEGVLEQGDVVVAVDGEPVSLSEEAVALIGRHAPGDRVVLDVVPADGGEARSVEADLMENPDAPGRPLLGVQLQTKDLQLDFPFEVAIDSNRIGGPSAGLAFTLSLLDVLTPGELTGGQRVAVTGTIEFDGRVGAVGGVAQKTVAVRRAGIDVFLVPSREYEDAMRFAGPDLRVEAIDTIDDALRVLAEAGGGALALPAGETGTEGT